MKQKAKKAKHKHPRLRYELSVLSLVAITLLYFTADYWAGAVLLPDTFPLMMTISAITFSILTGVMLWRWRWTNRFWAVMSCPLVFFVLGYVGLMFAPIFPEQGIRQFSQKATHWVTVGAYFALVTTVYYWLYPPQRRVPLIRIVVLVSLVAAVPLVVMLMPRIDSLFTSHNDVLVEERVVLRIAFDDPAAGVGQQPSSDYGSGMTNYNSRVTLYQCNRMWFNCEVLYQSTAYDLGTFWYSSYPLPQRITLASTDEGFQLSIGEDVVYASQGQQR